ncbi:MAG: hypothetical protein ACHQ2Y_08265 [Candidatus Lutacidiplasmatales archaeon]
MTDDDRKVLCPTCHASITVEVDWRMAQCPRCGGVVMRMSDDESYD